MGENFLNQICLIELKHITVTPPIMTEGQKTSTILKDISLKINKGEFITLLGRNGSGKSTFAKVAAGFRIAGVSGKISRSIGTSAAGKPIPIVMQQPEAAMIGATPWEDVVLLLEQNEMEAERIVEWAEEALCKVGMGSRMFQSIETLSGGQKQLVAIAGCLAIYSPILVLDEVTAMLDPEAAIFVMEQVRELNKSGITVIWITQKMDEIREGDRIVAMNDGAIAFDGEAENWFVRSDNGHNQSICEQLGFEAPYAVQVAWGLEELGVNLTPFPYTADMLAKAVQHVKR